MKIPAWMAIGLLATGLGGCGKGDSGNTSPASSPTPPATVTRTISGVAATGAAVGNGSVTLKCAGATGSVTTTTSAEGSYSFTARDLTLPCLAELDYSDSGTPQKMHAYVSGTGITNITPLTELLTAALLQGQPADIFANPDSNTFKTRSTEEQAAAFAAVKASLQARGITLPDGFDPLHDILVAKTGTQAGNSHDQLLDALGLQLSLGGTTTPGFTITVDGGIALTISGLSWGRFSNGGEDIYGFFASNPLQAGNSYFIDHPVITLSLAQYMATHPLAGSYSGSFNRNGGNCDFSVNSDASVSTGFVLPLAEGSNASTTYTIPAATFQAASALQSQSWLYHDEEHKKAGGLAIAGQNIVLIMIDGISGDMDRCVAALPAS